MIKVEEEKTKFKDKKILVVGLARSGVGAANLLSALGAEVTVTDRKPRQLLESRIRSLSPSIRVVTDDNPEECFESSDIIVVSPGVPSDIPPLVRSQNRGGQVIGEIELAFEIIQSRIREKLSGERRACEFIGITGTNGKSTTTTLVNNMLETSGFNTLLGGNIGSALTEKILDIVIRSEHISLPEYIVAEISSFQLETIKDFRPRVAAILNITPDHLDRYKSITKYADAKARIFEKQTEDDYLVLNADDPLIMNMISGRLEARGKRRPRVLFFSRKKEVKGLYLKGDKICLELPPSVNPGNGSLTYDDNLPLLPIDEIGIKGLHNLENAMAASLIALICGCSLKDIRAVLKSFSGLEHRLEFVKEIRGVRFINDSKGTNVGAVTRSLESLQDVILIMGGMDKGSDFSPLRDLVKEKVRLLILLGETKDKIKNVLGGVTETVKVNDLQDAVRVSLSKASGGDTVLLSPGCASFDMFADFEDRGEKFKEAVRGFEE